MYGAARPPSMKFQNRKARDSMGSPVAMRSPCAGADGAPPLSKLEMRRGSGFRNFRCVPFRLLPTSIVGLLRAGAMLTLNGKCVRYVIVRTLNARCMCVFNQLLLTCPRSSSGNCVHAQMSMHRLLRQ